MKKSDKLLSALATCTSLAVVFGFESPCLPGFAQDANTTAGAKPANSQGNVPDWLKEYDKPSTQTGTPGESKSASGDSKGSAGDFKGSSVNPTVLPSGNLAPFVPSSASTSASTSLAPVAPTSVSPVAPTAVSPASPHTTNSASAAPKPPAAPKPTKMLVGRLEEVVGVGAKLPVGVSLSGMKAQVPKMDKSAFPIQQASATQVQGLVASFPTDWQGSWGGPITIHAVQFDPICYEFDPEETAQMREIMAPGTVCNGNFSFQQQGRQVLAEPGQLVFPPHQSASSAREIQNQLKNSPFASMFSGMNGSMLSMLSTGMPVMYLGQLPASRGVAGNEVSATLIRNTVRELKKGVLEQNLIVRERDKSVNTGKVQNKICETVLRFTKLNQNQLYVQAVEITYRSDGHFANKVILYGTINRGAGSQYPMGLPGLESFPGLSPSGGGMGGMGGFDALNKMLKELQGN